MLLAQLAMAFLAFLALLAIFMLIGIHDRLRVIEYEANAIRNTLDIAVFDEDDGDHDIRFAERLDAWNVCPTKQAGDGDDWDRIE